MIKAAIDLGTVTSRLLIAEVCESDIAILHRESRITHMGEGLVASGVISQAAIERLSAAIVQFLATIEHYAIKYRCVCAPTVIATSALRDAQNQAEVLLRLRQIGVSVEVISGCREALLSFTGTVSGFSDLVGDVMTIDVGGGSTEVIVGRAAIAAKTDGASNGLPAISFAHSFDVGARRTSELFLGTNPTSAADIQMARSWVREQIAVKISAIRELPSKAIAVAGSATSAIAIREAMREYSPEKIHGANMSTDELEQMIVELAAMTLDRRQRVPGLEAARAPVIVGGLICLLEVLLVAGFNQFTASETDILQGVILSGI